MLAAGGGFSVFYALVHAPISGDTGSTVTPSAIVNAGLLPVAFILYGAVWFGLLALILDRYRPWIGTSAWSRGLRLGLFMAGLVTVLYLEPLPGTSTFGTTNLEWMIADAAPLILFGPTIAYLVPDDRPAPTRAPDDSGGPRPSWLAWSPLVAIVGAIGAGRAIDYWLIGIHSDVTARPWATLGWVLALGAVLGLGYVGLRRAFPSPTPVGGAVQFGLGFVGAIYVPFNLAYLLVADVGWSGFWDFVLRIGIDVAALAAGIVLIEYSLASRRAWGDSLPLPRTRGLGHEDGAAQRRPG